MLFGLMMGGLFGGELNLRIAFKSKDKETAVRRAAQIAKNQKTKLFVHTKKGKPVKVSINKVLGLNGIYQKSLEEDFMFLRRKGFIV